MGSPVSIGVLARMLREIRSEIHLEGDLDGAQREQLLKISARWPVYRTVSSEIKIRTTML